MPRPRLSLVEYQARLGRQRFKCAVCKQKRKLVVDYDRKTGEVRGLLCHGCCYDVISSHRCAYYLWERVKLWTAAAQYMDRHYRTTAPPPESAFPPGFRKVLPPESTPPAQGS